MKYLCLICADLRFMMEHLPEADAAKHLAIALIFGESDETIDWR